MWSFEQALRAGFVAVALAGSATGLAGCAGFAPVYGDAGIGVERHAFRYAAPETRLDQIIYQELVLRLGRSGDPQSPLVRVTASSATRSLTRTSVSRPAAQREAVVTARIEIVDAGGAVVFAGTRSASALFTTDGQVLADDSAQREASERAARALAETVRLTIIGALAQPVG